MLDYIVSRGLSKSNGASGIPLSVLSNFFDSRTLTGTRIPDDNIILINVLMEILRILCFNLDRGKHFGYDMMQIGDGYLRKDGVARLIEDNVRLLIVTCR